MNVTRREWLGTVPAAMAGAWALAGHGSSARAQGASYVPEKLGVFPPAAEPLAAA